MRDFERLQYTDPHMSMLSFQEKKENNYRDVSLLVFFCFSSSIKLYKSLISMFIKTISIVCKKNT